MYREKKHTQIYAYRRLYSYEKIYIIYTLKHKKIKFYNPSYYN